MAHPLDSKMNETHIEGRQWTSTLSLYIYNELEESICYIYTIVYPIIFIIGFIGNILSSLLTDLSQTSWDLYSLLCPISDLIALIGGLHSVVEPGLFGMPNLSIREWVSVETYEGILLASNDEFLSKDFCNRSLPKKFAFSWAPPENF